ncbi:vWA domain-containing protein [Streptodolium elevatio]
MSRPAQERAARRLRTRDAGWQLAADNWALKGLARGVYVRDAKDGPPVAWARIDSRGGIQVNSYQDGRPEEWAWVFTHLLLHLGLGHAAPDRLREAGTVPGGRVPEAYSVACCVAVERFAQEAVRVGVPLVHQPPLPNGDETALAERWAETGIPPELRGLGANGGRPCFDHLPAPRGYDATCEPWDYDWTASFARSLANAAQDAMAQANSQAGGVRRKASQGPWDIALNWFVSAYPLLGALAAGLTIVDDPAVARAWDISIAAVSASAGEIYVNPHADLTRQEWRFVLAHEMLHAALGHDRRVEGRDPELFNIACDFVINDWLVQMGVGDMPEGLLYDPQLSGLSAEAVYDTLATDLRRARKLRTVGGRTHGGKTGDVLGDWLCDPQSADRRGTRHRERKNTPPAPWERGAGRRDAVDLDAFYRRALSTGLAYHDTSRGLVPAGLIEEIRALEHPPLAWDAKLARWFDEHVRAPEYRRSYARASRRQAATPDIPRPGRHLPEEAVEQCTFGVVLDTSGSMDPELLGKALGAIASYASARDVPRARVVFCDAAAYDAGYMAVEDIAGSVRVRGRGGTVLQPGVDLLQRAEDFPADGPILVITDGYCDRVVVRREHAFLVPRGGRLPFTPRGPVFHVV